MAALYQPLNFAVRSIRLLLNLLSHLSVLKPKPELPHGMQPVPRRAVVKAGNYASQK